MAEFIRTEEKVVNIGDPVIFENNTDSDFEVSAGIIFHKSGLYDVSVVGRRTIVSKVAGRKKGRWYDVGSLSCRCSECGCKSQKEFLFCPNCGADMRGEDNESDRR